MLYNLLLDSPRIDARERRAIDANQVLAAHRGREPGLELECRDGQIELKAWARDVLDAMQPIAELLDGTQSNVFSDALSAQRQKVSDPQTTPSALMLNEMRQHGEGFAELARRLTEHHRNWFRGLELDPETDAWLQRMAAISIERQRAIEAADDIGFDEFLCRYFAQSEARPVELYPPPAEAVPAGML